MSKDSGAKPVRWSDVIRARTWIIGAAVAASPVVYWLAPKAAGLADGYLKSMARTQAVEVAQPIAAAATQAAAQQQAVQNAVVNVELKDLGNRLGRIENKIDRALGAASDGGNTVAKSAGRYTAAHGGGVADGVE